MNAKLTLEQTDLSELTLEEQAAGYASLREDDADRRGFLRRASDNPDCLARLTEGRKLMSLLDGLPPPAPPSAATLRRVAHELRLEIDRGEIPTWAYGATALLAAFTWTAGLYVTDHLLSGTSLLITAALVAFCCVAALRLMQHGVLLTFGAVASSIAAPFILPQIVASATVDQGLFGCGFIQLGTAAIPLGMSCYLVFSGRATNLGPLSLAGVAATGALAGQLALHAACPDINLLHTFLGHTSSVLIAALLGYAVTQASRRPVFARA